MGRRIPRLLGRRGHAQPQLIGAGAIADSGVLAPEFDGELPTGDCQMSFSVAVGGIEPSSASFGDESKSAIGGVDGDSIAPNAVNRRVVASVCPCPRWKRAMDVMGSVSAVVLLLPLFAAIAFLIKCGSRGPVFFHQTRYGLNGQPFTLWKFRTIVTAAASEQHHSHVSQLMDSDAPLTKLDSELALIPGGRVLRKYGLDELPQIFNVLRGEMSLVGPRPDVLPLAKYQPWQRERFKVLPGITGLWQVCGKNDTTFSEMVELDISYIFDRSAWLDTCIILRTIPSMLLS